MANAFDRSEYPQREPSVLVIGDRWTWKRTDLTNYSVSLYALSYVAVRQGDTGATFSITATEVGNDYVVEVASATTATYPVGVYDWSAYITRSADSERVAIGSGSFRLEQNLASDAGDPRTFAVQQIDRLEASLARLSAQDVSSYSVAARSATRKTMAEVRRELNHWRHVRAAEVGRERVARGLSAGNNIRVRLS